MILALTAAVTGGGLSLLASGHPDGLEWSLFGNAEAGYASNMGLNEEDYGITGDAAERAASIQEKTAFLPDYAFAEDAENPAGTSASGLIGIALVAAASGLICLAGGYARKRRADEAGQTGGIA